MNANGWREASLGEVCDQLGGVIQTGPFGSQLHESDYSPDGIPVVMPKDINGGRIATASIARVSPEHVERLSRHKLNTGDIVYGRRGDIGRQALVREEQRGWLCGTGCLRLSLGDSILNSTYLHYYLRQGTVIAEIAGQAVGATLPNLNTEILRGVRVRFPSLRAQRKIASTLNAYDELIESNQRRIRVLEGMARALYREWFVEFRFPGHAKVSRVASVLGGIPKGWEVRTVEESFEVCGGGTPSRKEERFWAGGTIQWFTPSDLTAAGTMFMDDSSEHISDVGLAESSAKLFPPFSVMMTSRATIGAIAINTRGACTNQGFITCLPRERAPLYFLFHWLTETVPTFQQLASGATFKEISRGVFKSIKMLLPPVELARHFDGLVSPVAERILNLQRQSANLRKTRDMLLPRLLRGAIQGEE